MHLLRGHVLQHVVQRLPSMASSTSFSTSAVKLLTPFRAVAVALTAQRGGMLPNQAAVVRPPGEGEVSGNVGCMAGPAIGVRHIRPAAYTQHT